MRHTSALCITFFLICGPLCATLPAQTRNPSPELPRLRNSPSNRKRDPKSDDGKTRRDRTPAIGGEDEVIDVETSLVVCDVLVLDKQGRSVAGLKRGDFVVTEDGAPQQIDTFALGDGSKVPRSIVLILDSGSSSLPYLDTSIEAAKTLVDKLAPDDRMAIVTDNISLLADFTRDKSELKKKLESLRRRLSESDVRKKWFGGPSSQFSALLATLNELFDEQHARPIVIFQTDGDEVAALPPLPADAPPLLKLWARKFSLADVYDAAERSRATIYTVIPGIRLMGVTPDEQLERARATPVRAASLFAESDPARKDKLLNRLRNLPDESLKLTAAYILRQQSAAAGVAELTGGWTDFIEDPAQAAEVYARIFSGIERRYIIGYRPTNKARDGKRRKVSIEVRDHPEYTIWGRKAYYAPEAGK